MGLGGLSRQLQFHVFERCSSYYSMQSCTFRHSIHGRHQRTLVVVVPN